MAVNYNLMEVTCQKAISGASFPQGTADWIFTIGHPNCWNPSKSYFKIDMKIEGSGASNPIPKVSDGIAYADNVAGNLFSNAFMKFEGQDVSTITSFLPQTSALKKRLFKSHGWLKTIGKGACGDLSSQLSRTYLASSGVPGDNDNGDTAIAFKARLDSDYGAAAISYVTAAGVCTVTQQGGVTPSDWATGVTQIFPGDIIVIAGVKYGVLSVAASPATTITIAAGSLPNSAGNTIDYYFLRQQTGRTNTSKNIVSVLWQPPLGIFDCKEFLGAGNYKISLTPDANYLNNAVETRNTRYNNTSATVADSYNFSIVDIKFYAYQAKANIPDGPQTLDLMETLVMSKQLTGSATGVSTGNYQFSVPPSTSYISIFVQDNRTGSSPLYPPSMFKAPNGATMTPGDMTLTNIQCIYASITKPSTNWSSGFNTDVNPLSYVLPVPASQTNGMVQRYFDSFLEFQNSANSGFGTETFNEWAQRGPFYMWVYARDQSDRSTEVQLNATFRDINAQNTNIFIVAWYHNTVQYTVNNGMITALSSRQV